jgi:hypothetical protein
VGDRWREVRVVDLLLWVGVPLLGVVWVVSRYRSTWWFLDEWLVLDPDRSGWDALFAGHNGQLMVLNRVTYLLQWQWFGLDGRQAVVAGYAAGLVALHVSVAILLRRLLVPSVLAVLGGGLITYFGAGAENAVLAFNQGHNLALALTCLAATVALGDEHTTRRAMAVAGLLLAAFLCASSTAAMGSVLVAVVVLLSWPRRLWAVVLVAPLVAQLAWYVVGVRTALVGTSTATAFELGWRLLLRAAAALAGAGPSGAEVGKQALGDSVLGVVVLLAVGAVAAFGAIEHRIPRRCWIGLAGGVAGAVVGAALIAKQRTGVIIVDMTPSPGSVIFGTGVDSAVTSELTIPSRYVQWVALFLFVGVLPIVVAAFRPSGGEAPALATVAIALGLVVVFAVGLDGLRSEEEFFDTWGATNRPLIQQAVAALEQCGADGSADPIRRVIPYETLTVRQLHALIEGGAFPPDFGRPPTPEVVARMCDP